MQIKDIEIKNYRRFKEFRCEFHPRFTLLAGENGTGKTSLLAAMNGWSIATMFQAFQIPHDAFHPTLSDAHVVDNFDVADEKWQQRMFPVQVNSQFSLLPETALPRVGRTLDANGANNPDYWGEMWAALNPIGRAMFQTDWNKAIPFVCMYAAQKPMGSSKAGAIQKPFEQKQQIYGHQVQLNISTLVSWFQHYELRRLQENTVPLVFRKVKEAVLKAIHAEDIGYIARDNSLQVKHAGQGWRAFDQLSDGQQRIAAIFCDLAMRLASLNSHLGEDCIEKAIGIVSIDELDLHLHPKWQRDVIPSLLSTFPNMQFVATSHSPFLLQAAFEHGAVVDMATGKFMDAQDTSIEDIAEHNMGVEHPQRGARFIAMKEAAQAYYELLERVPEASEAEKTRIKSQLDALMIPYANEPAYAAMLEMRRMAAGI